MQNKVQKKWKRPVLTSLIREISKQERVLEFCKHEDSMRGGPNIYYIRCHSRIPGTSYCETCKDYGGLS
jgi:hypothetical protein